MLQIPLYQTHASAGFPSPADDYIDRTLDLNTHLIQRPEATFFVRVRGDSMEGAGISSGDLLIVDRSKEITPGDIIIAAIDGELTVKRYLIENHCPVLMPENPLYSPIKITPESDFRVWGRVCHIVKSL